MSDDFVDFEPLLDENYEIAENYLITIFQFEKLVIGKGTAEYTCYCLDEYGEPIVDINDFMDFGKNCTLSEYEKLFKERHKGLKLDKVPYGLFQLITRKWVRV